jgi:DNA-directed RNA polymerase sigma subunit (sigma70/sigma32)
LHGAVGLLNPLERRVLELRYIHDEPLSLAGAAESIGLPKHKLQHVERMALRKLRQSLASGKGLRTRP